jgi:CheY-like chemotaxis protein
MRIVLMSGYADEPEYHAAGDLPVLAKPFVKQDLVQALQRANKGKK